MEFDEQGSRRRFLRQLGIGLAVGVGAAALPSRAAARPNSTEGAGECCASISHCGTCSGTQKNYRCDCVSFFYCTGCRPDQGTCFPANC